MTLQNLELTAHIGIHYHLIFILKLYKFNGLLLKIGKVVPSY